MTIHGLSRVVFTSLPKGFALLVLLFLQPSLPALSLPLGAVNPAPRIIDGDTLVLGDEKIRLNGIDAPELSQTCTTPSGENWPCGQKAKQKLQALAAKGKLTCKGSKTDLYHRTLATCYVAGQDINAAMVRSGAAVAFRRYSRAYVPLEQAARKDRLGIWQGSLQMPWDYRKAKHNHLAKRTSPVPSAGATVANSVGTGPKGCNIKGNISKAGRIYHLPGSASYAATKISLSKGERWFCSEQEAKAAGWRAPH